MHALYKMRHWLAAGLVCLIPSALAVAQTDTSSAAKKPGLAKICVIILGSIIVVILVQQRMRCPSKRSYLEPISKLRTKVDQL